MNRAECKKEIASRLSSNPISAPIVDIFAEQLVDVFEVPVESSEPQTSGAGFGFGLVVRNWAVRDDDVGLIKTLGAALGVMLPALVTSGSVTFGTAMGFFMALASMLGNIYKKGTKLSGDEIKVLSAMKATGTPMTVEDILSRVEAVGLSASAVATTLNTLSEAVSRNGIQKLVEKNSQGLWLLRGV